jgi:hypothetical protein
MEIEKLGVDTGGEQGYKRNNSPKTTGYPEPAGAELREEKSSRGKGASGLFPRTRLCQNTINRWRRQAGSDAECEPRAQRTS